MGQRLIVSDKRTGKIELAATRKEFVLRDESGYRFDVVAVLDQELGWSASVTFTAEGFKTDEAAIAHLVPAVEHFLRLLK